MTIMISAIPSDCAGRLWFVLREGRPKPFMKLVDGQSLLEKTYCRVANLCREYQENSRAKLLIVINRASGEAICVKFVNTFVQSDNRLVASY